MLPNQCEDVANTFELSQWRGRTIVTGIRTQHGSGPDRASSLEATFGRVRSTSCHHFGRTTKMHCKQNGHLSKKNQQKPNIFKLNQKVEIKNQKYRD